VRALRGDHQLNARNALSAHGVGAKRTHGRKIRRRPGVWRVYVYTFYEVLTQLFAPSRNKPGGWHVTADALTRGRAYLEQVVNFGGSLDDR
jgi:hypothetical protein